MDGSSSHRRESAKKVDLNRTPDDTYKAAMARFTSWGPRDFRKEAPIRGGDVARYEDDCSPDKSGNYSYMHRSPEQDKKIYQRKPPRHSMPANVTKSKRRQSKQAPNPEIIHEEEVREFEQAHCYGNIDPAADPIPVGQVSSPPMKFYKQNLDPYPTSEPTWANEGTKPHRPKQLSYAKEVGGSSSQESTLRSCPEKPKRVLLKQNDGHLKKELSNAHFSGAYKNYEIRSPFYGHLQRPVANDRTATMTSSTSNTNEDLFDNRQSSQYKVVNKYGEVVEYTQPFNEIPSTNKPFASDTCDLEVFCVDPRACEQMINDNFHFLNDVGPHEIDRSQRMRRGSHLQVTDLDKSNDSGEVLSVHVPITDLDKSVDTEEVVLRRAPNKSHATASNKSMIATRPTDVSKRNSNRTSKDRNSLSKWSDNLHSASGRTRNDPSYISYGVHIYSHMTMISPDDLKAKVCVPGSSQFGFSLGTYRLTNVMLRNYETEGDDVSADFKLFADSIIRRDFEVLK